MSLWKDEITAQLRRIEDRQSKIMERQRKEEEVLVTVLRSLSNIATAMEELSRKPEGGEDMDPASRKMQEGIANLMAYGGPKAGER